MANEELKRRLQQRLSARDPMYAAAMRIRASVDLAHALTVSGRVPSRAVVRELRLECYVYPLPEWRPGELEQWGMM